MNRINHFLSAINVPAWFVRPRWGRRFAAIPKAKPWTPKESNRHVL